MYRTLFVGSCCVAAFMASSLNADDTNSQQVFEKSVAPFLKKHCLTCHNADKKEGDITLHNLTGNFQQESTTWTTVYERVNAGEMPPEKQPRPMQDELDKILHWLKQGLELN
jgi:predicted molibdopterin-dependent oxidoreductase YjgC